MNTLTIVLLVILVILIIALVVMYFLGRKAQKRQEEQQAQIEASKQSITLMAIDKKRKPIKDSGLPQFVIDQTPKLMRRSKLPIVKAKIGPKYQILIADEKVFDLIPLKKEIRAEVSGLYIVGVRGIRGPLEAPAKKEKWYKRIFKKNDEKNDASKSKDTPKTTKQTKQEKPAAAPETKAAVKPEGSKNASKNKSKKKKKK